MNEVEIRTTLIARRMARAAGVSEAMWELFLPEAYAEVFNSLPNNSLKPTRPKRGSKLKKVSRAA